MSEAHTALIDRFYCSFQKLDHTGMIPCYHPDVSFSDPVFTSLQGWKAGAMWRMLCDRAQDFSLRYDGVEANDQSGRAHWVATYTFGATGNKVVNDIQARFTFKDGLIISHTDRFDLYKWTRMALGAKGTLLGWLPPIKNAVRKQAAGGLKLFIEKQHLSADNVGAP